jgi:hypothetical protein
MSIETYNLDDTSPDPGDRVVNNETTIKPQIETLFDPDEIEKIGIDSFIETEPIIDGPTFDEQGFPNNANVPVD